MVSGSFPRPAYDSDWVSIAQGDCETLTHGLGGNTDNYVVDLQFKDTDIAINGVHQRYYGGDELSTGSERGAYWRLLDNATINVCRQSSDSYAGQIRVRIWVYN
jgi:hypothetical protein